MKHSDSSENRALLSDAFGRQFSYLRLSVTDVCNFRCVYCLPNGYKRPVNPQPHLSVEQVRNLIQAFAELGVTKVRLTGGEPTVRRDIVEIAAAVSAVPGIRTVALTTNGYRLASIAEDLKKAGVNAINLSVDSLDRVRFHRITGTDRLADVMSGLDRVLELGIAKVKLNAVLLRDLDDEELGRFLEFVRHRPVSVRFIELMRTDENVRFFADQHVSGQWLKARLSQAGWVEAARASDAGPSVDFAHVDYSGTIGIIAPYAKDFCSSCNRLRVTSQGNLRLCLFGESDYPLAGLLSDSASKEELKRTVVSLLSRKLVSHFLHEDRSGNTQNLASIGG